MAPTVAEVPEVATRTKRIAEVAEVAEVDQLNDSGPTKAPLEHQVHSPVRGRPCLRPAKVGLGQQAAKLPPLACDLQAVR